MSPRSSQPLSIEHTVLGLIRQHPLHGYEIYQRLKTHTVLGVIWKPRQSQFYAVLKKLEQAGLVAATIETQAAYPPRRVLHLTEQGGTAFNHWISRPVDTWERVPQEFRARLFFAQSVGDQHARTLIEQQRRVSSVWLADLQQQMQTFLAYQSSEWLMLQFEIGQVQAFLQWLDRCALHFADPVFVIHSIALLNDSARIGLARQFVDYVCSPAGQAILEQHGFIPANQASTPVGSPGSIATSGPPPAAGPGAPTLTIFAAATFTDVFQALARAFRNIHGDITIHLAFAGSHYLADELVRGTAADLFASADRTLVAPLVQAGRIEPDSERIFARNRLIIVTQEQNPLALASLRDLAKPGLKLALGSRSTAIGHYALDMLHEAEHHGRLDPAEHTALLQNVAFYEQDVRAVLSRVVSGEADAGIVYTSDYHSMSGSATQSLRALRL